MQLPQLQIEEVHQMISKVLYTLLTVTDSKILMWVVEEFIVWNMLSKGLSFPDGS